MKLENVQLYFTRHNLLTRISTLYLFSERFLNCQSFRIPYQRKQICCEFPDIPSLASRVNITFLTPNIITGKQIARFNVADVISFRIGRVRKSIRPNKSRARGGGKGEKRIRLKSILSRRRRRLLSLRKNEGLRRCIPCNSRRPVTMIPCCGAFRQESSRSRLRRWPDYRFLSAGSHEMLNCVCHDPTRRRIYLGPMCSALLFLLSRSFSFSRIVPKQYNARIN